MTELPPLGWCSDSSNPPARSGRADPRSSGPGCRCARSSLRAGERAGGAREARSALANALAVRAKLALVLKPLRARGRSPMRSYGRLQVRGALRAARESGANRAAETPHPASPRATGGARSEKSGISWSSAGPRLRTEGRARPRVPARRLPEAGIARSGAFRRNSRVEPPMPCGGPRRDRARREPRRAGTARPARCVAGSRSPESSGDREPGQAIIWLSAPVTFLISGCVPKVFTSCPKACAIETRILLFVVGV